VRSDGEPPAVVARRAAEAVLSLHPALSYSARIVGDRVRASLAQERVLAAISGFFGVAAAALAGLGLYGVAAYGVERRKPEFGVRLALGGSPRALARLVLVKTTLLAVAGVALGLGASLGLGRFVETLLHGLGPRDPIVLTASAAGLIGIAAVAAWIPARRAARVDPAELLRRS
jgi:ABC-type antimicrobial peptide transport system permease subunit